MSIIIYAIVPILLIIISAFSFFLLLLCLIFIIDSVVKGHDLPTSRRATKALFRIISERKNAKNFYDLGCGYGALACRVKKKFPNLCVYAVDNNPVRLFFAKIRAFAFRQNVKFLQEDIFSTNLSNADIVYAYLWYDIMPSLEKKLQTELKQGAIVITNTSNFPIWKPIQKIVTCPRIFKMPDFETLFVYQKE